MRKTLKHGNGIDLVFTQHHQERKKVKAKISVIPVLGLAPIVPCCARRRVRVRVRFVHDWRHTIHSLLHTRIQQQQELTYAVTVTTVFNSSSSSNHHGDDDALAKRFEHGERGEKEPGSKRTLEGPTNYVPRRSRYLLLVEWGRVHDKKKRRHQYKLFL